MVQVDSNYDMMKTVCLAAVNLLQEQLLDELFQIFARTSNCEKTKSWPMEKKRKKEMELKNVKLQFVAPPHPVAVIRCSRPD